MQISHNIYTFVLVHVEVELFWYLKVGMVFCFCRGYLVTGSLAGFSILGRGVKNLFSM